MLGYLEPSARPITQYARRETRFIPAHLDERYALAPIRGVTIYESFRHFCEERRPQKIIFQRGHALGDCLMLIAIIKALRRHFELASPIYVSTEPKMIHALAALNGPDVVFERKREFWHRFGADCVFNLNSCLELDHKGLPWADWHRMDLYAQALGFSRCELAY